MSTTKLPEAFEPKTISDAPKTERLGAGAWANGYNACLDVTGAKELWEALEMANSEGIKHRYYCMISEQGTGCTCGHGERVKKISAALAKSNPSNTVG